MPDQLMFVQFPHPGGEHIPHGPEMGWNTGDHARKFLKARGTYLADDVIRSGPLAFWGEWEPQSRIVETFPRKHQGLPRVLHEPYWQVPSHRGSLQNTDPLVFGDHFLYTNCRQGRNRKLRELAPGSMILFGSKVGGQFALDTLFVVGNGSQEFTPASSPELDMPAWIEELVLGPLRDSSDSQGDRFRLYRGRTHQDAPDGPFSFVPCRPYERGRSAFARPAIHLDRRWVSPNLAQGAKATAATEKEIRELWEIVVHQVVDVAGLAIGVQIDAPPRVA